MSFVTASMMILRELGVTIGPILASAGIAGIAIGFGAQNLVRDVISGFFIILEDQIRVGDIMTRFPAGQLPPVEKVTMRDPEEIEMLLPRLVNGHLADG